MTIPAHAGQASVRHHVDTLPIPSPPAPADTTARSLRVALTLPLSASAFRLYAAVLLATPAGHMVSTEGMAQIAGLTDHQARPLVGELVRHGLLVRRAVVVQVAGRDQRAQRNRYLIATPAVTP